MASNSLSSKRHLVVVAKAGITVPPSLRTAEGLSNTFALPPESSGQIRIRPLFHSRPRREYGSPNYAGGQPPSISIDRFYHVDAPDDELEAIHRRLLQHQMVEAAFIKPPTRHAGVASTINKMTASPAAAPATSPDFTGRQGYLEVAPGGVDARYAWTVNGGDGTGVNVIDVEGEWRFSHEDLQHNKGGVVAGTPPGDLDWRNHGTAVIGTICGDANGYGITGIAPNVNLRAISIFPESYGSATAIQQAADLLSPGDIILLEMHRAGPRFNFDDSRQDQAGFIAIEWWPDDLAAIQYATSKGIIVVGAGGNGGENLDDSLYDQNPASPNGPFPSSWTNPFRRAAVDSGAIVVGAGAPPPGTHNNSNWGTDRSRLSFSNYGLLMDSQGWGREVTTCGYGDLQAGVTEDTWYTDQFSGTSSASPIVLGALACVQGALKAAGSALLTPATARNLLRSSGSPQNDGSSGPSSQRIGNRPDIRQMFQLTLPAAPNLAAVQSSAAREPSPQQDQPNGQVRDIGGGRISIVINIYNAGSKHECK